MKIIYITSIAISASLLFAGCMPRSFAPGSEHVRLTGNSKYIANKCKFLDSISVKNIHGDLSLTATERYWVQDDVNYLKNAAKNVGANVVVLGQHERVASQEQQRPPVAHMVKHMHKHMVTRVRYNIDAKMYYCPTGVRIKGLNTSKYFQHIAAG